MLTLSASQIKRIEQSELARFKSARIKGQRSPLAVAYEAVTNFHTAIQVMTDKYRVLTTREGTADPRFRLAAMRSLNTWKAILNANPVLKERYNNPYVLDINEILADAVSNQNYREASKLWHRAFSAVWSFSGILTRDASQEARPDLARGVGFMQQAADLIEAGRDASKLIRLAIAEFGKAKAQSGFSNAQIRQTLFFLSNLTTPEAQQANLQPLLNTLAYYRLGVGI